MWKCPDKHRGAESEHRIPVAVRSGEREHLPNCSVSSSTTRSAFVRKKCSFEQLPVVYLTQIYHFSALKRRGSPSAMTPAWNRARPGDPLGWVNMPQRQPMVKVEDARKTGGQGLKPVPLLSAFCGTTEAVPIQKTGRTRVFPQPAEPCPLNSLALCDSGPTCDCPALRSEPAASRVWTCYTYWVHHP
jgi:hypothetical protein